MPPADRGREDDMTCSRWTWLTLTLAVAACSDGTGPDQAPAPAGVDFGLAEGSNGAFYADARQPSAADPLEAEFAVAVPDSLGGLVLLAYDGGTRNLFILQMNDDGVGTYACGPVEDGPACHARVFENVREEGGVVEVDGRLDLTSGSLTLSEVGASVLTGAFEAHFERTDGTGEASVDVFNGTIAVDLLPGFVENAGLLCLVELSGGGTSCGG
jgi:hypothetical protein